MFRNQVGEIHGRLENRMLGKWNLCDGEYPNSVRMLNARRDGVGDLDRCQRIAIFHGDLLFGRHPGGAVGMICCRFSVEMVIMAGSTVWLEESFREHLHTL